MAGIAPYDPRTQAMLNYGQPAMPALSGTPGYKPPDFSSKEEFDAYQAALNNAASKPDRAALLALSAITGGVAGPALAGALGSVGGGAATGALAGGLGAGASGGDKNDILKGAALGGIGGGIGGYLGAPTGDSFQNAADDALAGSNNYYVGNNAPGIDAMNASTLADAGFQQAGDDALASSGNYYVGNNAAAIDANNANAFPSTDLNVPDDYGNPLKVGATEPTAPVSYGDDFVPPEGADTESGIKTLKDTLPAAQPNVDNLSTTPTAEAPNLATVPSTNQPPSATSAAMDAFKNWALKNPVQALMLGSLIAGKLKGGSNTGVTGTPTASSQAQLTANKATPLQRTYVPPPAGYRPGFDPEHRYFTGIGAVGAGAASTPKTTQDKVLPGTQG